jgi:hypothetical protein
MKVVNATWEQRNLGVRAIEIELEKWDKPDAISGICQNFGSGYIVARVPVGAPELILELQRIGFVFSETMFYCSHFGGGFELNSVQNRLFTRAFSRKMSSAGIEDLFTEIRSGVFSTDRISLDSKFGVAMANRRYCYWIQDEISRGANVYSAHIDGLEIGFFALKKNKIGESFLFLSGLFRKYNSSGLGFCPHFLGILQGLNNGERRVRLAVSSNNKGALALHMGKGHVLDEVSHIFCKHQ